MSDLTHRLASTAPHQASNSCLDAACSQKTQTPPRRPFPSNNTQTKTATTPKKGLRRLNALAKKLRARRVAAGALQLASPEVKFELGDDEAHDPIDVGVYQVGGGD